MKLNKLLLFLTLSTFINCISIEAQITVQGVVRSDDNLEVLIGATIDDSSSNNWAYTDEKGRFTLKIPKESIVTISYVGYKSSKFKVSNDTFLNVRLSSSIELQDVVVSAERNKNPNVSTVRAIDIEKIPTIGGKPDIIKGLQTLPGVQGIHEGSSVPVIRGGSPGENAYFLDGAPLIYVNHLAGFFSVFNTDMINSLELHKGGFPAKYGGKLSSIVNIHQNSGNKKEFEGKVSIGITDLSASIQGPIIEDKLSFILTARKTLIDYLILLGTSVSNENSAQALYGFHDINGKFSYQLNNQNTLNLNIYQGDDYLKFWGKSETTSSKFNNVWGNFLASASWETFLGSSIVGNTILSYTKYRVKNTYDYYLENENVINEHYSSLSLYSLKSDWNKTFSTDFNLRFGIQSRLNQSIPSRNVLNNEEVIDQTKEKYYGTISTYIETDYKIDDCLAVRPGLRVSYYNFLSNGEFYLDPRIRVRYEMNNDLSIYSSFMRVHQFEHLFSTQGEIGQNEIWIPADNKIPAAQSDQISIGYINSMIEKFTIKSSIYYKWFNNLSNYKEGFTQILGDPNYYDKIVNNGSGNAYGIEILVRKDKGKWKGSISYAYNRSFREFEEVNSGKVYPYNYDRPHNFNLQIHRRLSKKWEVSLGWYYQSGLPYTPVLGKHNVPDLPSEDGSQEFYEVLYYDEKNSGRVESYHRLDLSASRSRFNASDKLINELTFGLYNAYAHNNPYFYFYNDQVGNPITTSVHRPRRDGFAPLKRIGVSYFPIIPYVSYTWYF